MFALSAVFLTVTKLVRMSHLPAVMFSPQFRWSYLLTFLEALESQHSDVGGRFIAQFDEIVVFRST